MPKEPRWHQMVKEILKEIGESRGYDVSQSEIEMHFAKRFAMYDDEERQIHTLSYKPDVVWKKKNRFRAIFEVEYLNPKNSAQVMEKRKYALGSLMLALIAKEDKSCDYLVFITNNEDLCNEVSKFIELSRNFVKNLEDALYYCHPSKSRIRIKKDFQDWLVKEYKI